MGSHALRRISSGEKENDGLPPMFNFAVHKLSEVSASLGPTARSGHSACIQGRFMIVFGGYFKPTYGNGVTFSGVWVLDLLNLKWTQLKFDNKDVPVATASTAIWLVGDKLYTWGGSGHVFGHSTNDDMFVFDFAKSGWTNLPRSGDRPKGVYGHSMSFSAADSQLYVFGGTYGSSNTDDVYAFSLEDGSWSHIQTTGTGPVPRYCHRIVPCADGFYVTFGGTTALGFELDEGKVIYRFTYATHSWTTHECLEDPENGHPMGRRCHAIASNSHCVIVCGGVTSQDEIEVPVADVWRLDLPARPLEKATDDSHGARFKPAAAKWVKMPFELAHPTFFHTAVLSESDCMFVFGGNVVHPTGVRARSNECHYAYVDVPPLMEMAWRCLNASYPWLQNLPTKDLTRIGIPPYFCRGFCS